MNEASKPVIQGMLPPPRVIAEKLGGREKQLSTTPSGDGGNRIGPRLAPEVYMKGMNSVGPEACIFPYTESYIPSFDI